jgi:hypothetical protein
MNENLADDMAELLERAAIWFRGYEAHHRAKGTHDSNQKAVTNCHRAEEIEAMVAKYRATQITDQPQLPLPPVSDGVELDMFGWMRKIDESAMKRSRK